MLSLRHSLFKHYHPIAYLPSYILHLLEGSDKLHPCVNRNTGDAFSSLTRHAVYRLTQVNSKHWQGHQTTECRRDEYGDIWWCNRIQERWWYKLVQIWRYFILGSAPQPGRLARLYSGMPIADMPVRTMRSPSLLFLCSLCLLSVCTAPTETPIGTAIHLTYAPCG